MVDKYQEQLAEKLPKSLLPSEMVRSRKMYLNLRTKKMEVEQRIAQLMKEITQLSQRGEDFEQLYYELLEARKARDIYLAESGLEAQKQFAHQQNFIKMIDQNIDEMEKDQEFIKSWQDEIKKNRNDGSDAALYHFNNHSSSLFGALGDIQSLYSEVVNGVGPILGSSSSQNKTLQTNINSKLQNSRSMVSSRGANIENRNENLGKLERRVSTFKEIDQRAKTNQNITRNPSSEGASVVGGNYNFVQQNIHKQKGPPMKRAGGSTSGNFSNFNQQNQHMKSISHQKTTRHKQEGALGFNDNFGSTSARSGIARGKGESHLGNQKSNQIQSSAQSENDFVQMNSAVRQRTGRNSNKKYIGGEELDDSIDGLAQYQFGTGQNEGRHSQQNNAEDEEKCEICLKKAQPEDEEDLQLWLGCSYLDGCGKWYHVLCLNMQSEEYRRITDENEVWFCSDACEKQHNSSKNLKRHK